MLRSGLDVPTSGRSGNGDRGVPNGEIFAYDDAGDLLATFATEELGDNSVPTLALDVAGVSRLEFAFVGSAAIDELVV